MLLPPEEKSFTLFLLLLFLLIIARLVVVVGFDTFVTVERCVAVAGVTRGRTLKYNTYNTQSKLHDCLAALTLLDAVGKTLCLYDISVTIFRWWCDRSFARLKEFTGAPQPSSSFLRLPL